MSPQKTEEKQEGGLAKNANPTWQKATEEAKKPTQTNRRTKQGSTAMGHYTKEGTEENCNTPKHSTQLSTTQNTTLHSTEWKHWEPPIAAQLKKTEARHFTTLLSRKPLITELSTQHCTTKTPDFTAQRESTPKQKTTPHCRTAKESKKTRSDLHSALCKASTWVEENRAGLLFTTECPLPLAEWDEMEE